MAETTWTEDSVPPPPKKKVPTWVWFCGGGCLALVILGALAAGLAFKYVKQSLDPEQQWQHVAELLPFTERPPELQLVFGWNLGVGMYMFKDSRGFIAMLMEAPAGDKGKMRKQMLDETFSGSFAGMGGRKDMKKGTVNVQGRELDLLRYYALGPESHGSGADDEAGDASVPDVAPAGRPKINRGAAVWVDVTPEGAERTLMLMLVRGGEHDSGSNSKPSSVSSSEPVSDAEIQSFLKPFKVGNDR